MLKDGCYFSQNIFWFFVLVICLLVSSTSVLESEIWTKFCSRTVSVSSPKSIFFFHLRKARIHDVQCLQRKIRAFPYSCSVRLLKVSIFIYFTFLFFILFFLFVFVSFIWISCAQSTYTCDIVIPMLTNFVYFDIQKLWINLVVVMNIEWKSTSFTSISSNKKFHQ